MLFRLWIAEGCLQEGTALDPAGKAKFCLKNEVCYAEQAEALGAARYMKQNIYLVILFAYSYVSLPYDIPKREVQAYADLEC